MGLSLYKNESGCKYSSKILHGGDTDISSATIIKMTPDCFVHSIYYHNNEKLTNESITVSILDRGQMDEEFNLQLGTPMQYITEEDYNEFLK